MKVRKRLYNALRIIFPYTLLYFFLKNTNSLPHFVAECVLCVWCLLYTQQCFRSYVRLLFHWALFDLFCFFTHFWHLPKQNIRTQTHAHRRFVVQSTTYSVHKRLSNLFYMQTCISFILNFVHWNIKFFKDFFTNFIEIVVLNNFGTVFQINNWC